MAKYGGTVRIIIDNLGQVELLEEYENHRGDPKRWSAFIKVDGGEKYAIFLVGWCMLTRSQTSWDLTKPRVVQIVHEKCLCIECHLCLWILQSCRTLLWIDFSGARRIIPDWGSTPCQRCREDGLGGSARISAQRCAYPTLRAIRRVYSCCTRCIEQDKGNIAVVRHSRTTRRCAQIINIRNLSMRRDRFQGITQCLIFSSCTRR